MKQSARVISAVLFSGFLLQTQLQRHTLAIGSELAPQEHGDSNVDLIFALDGCIQRRFEDIDKYFGLRRLMKIGETPHRFKPENARELDVVRQLEKYEVRVALYLGGRRVLGAKPDQPAWNAKPNRMINGPVSITSIDRPDSDLPESPELWSQAQKAMISFQTSDTYEFAAKGWSFIARPVRARQACLQCHQGDRTFIAATGTAQPPNSLKVGDPLGVILYAHKHAR